MRLLGWTGRQMTAAIGSGAIVLTSTPLDKWAWREDLVAASFELAGRLESVTVMAVWCKPHPPEWASA